MIPSRAPAAPFARGRARTLCPLPQRTYGCPPRSGERGSAGPLRLRCAPAPPPARPPRVLVAPLLRALRTRMLAGRSCVGVGRKPFPKEESRLPGTWDTPFLGLSGCTVPILSVIRPPMPAHGGLKRPLLPCPFRPNHGRRAGLVAPTMPLKKQMHRHGASSGCTASVGTRALLPCSAA